MAAAGSTWTLQRQTTQPLKSSVSMLFNNLHSNGRVMAYTHINQVSLIDDGARLESGTAIEHSNATEQGKSDDAVSGARWCRLAFGDVLVVTSYGGLVQIFDHTGTRLLHAHEIRSLADQGGAGGAASSPVALLCACADGADRVFVGTQDDRVVALTCTQQMLSRQDTLVTLPAAVVALAASPAASAAAPQAAYLAAADEDGNLVVLSLPAGIELARIAVAASDGAGADMITALAFTAPDLLVSASVAGKVRLYAVGGAGGGLALAAEIDAHARPIHAMDVWADRCLLACGAEDCHVSVWTLPASAAEAVALGVSGGGTAIRLRYMGAVTNALICGVAFNKMCAQPMLSVAAYDCAQLNVLSFRE